MAGTGYSWHILSDGQGVFPALDGGWYLCSNCEAHPADGGGVSVIQFSPTGAIVDAKRLAGGQTRNCSAGVTPWGTYLTCEEYELGQVHEIDPTVVGSTARPAMGVFRHEAACVDPVREHVYLTEDQPDGCLYRFTPDAYPDLSTGTLEVMFVAADNSVTWQEIPDPTFAGATPTRHQLPAATRCNGGEGMWYDDGIVYFTTKGDRRVWMYDAAAGRIEILYDLAAADADTPLHEIDNIFVSKSGDLWVCEDGDNFEICMITPDRYISSFVRMDPAIHGAAGSNEVTGVHFDPSGTRMYFAAQRSFGQGAIYEISGPFRLTRPAAPIKRADPTPPPATTTETPPATVPLPPRVVPPPLRDRIAPGVRIRSLKRRLKVGTFLERGLSLQLSVTEPAGIELVLRAPGYGVLARHRTSVAVRGLVRLRLRVTRAAFRRRLRRRRVRTLNAQLTIRVTDLAGNATTSRRRVRVIPPH